MSAQSQRWVIGCILSLVMGCTGSPDVAPSATPDQGSEETHDIDMDVVLDMTQPSRAEDGGFMDQGEELLVDQGADALMDQGEEADLMDQGNTHPLVEAEVLMDAITWDMRLGQTAPGDVRLDVSEERIHVFAARQRVITLDRVTGAFSYELDWDFGEAASGTMKSAFISTPEFMILSGQTTSGRDAILEEPIDGFIPVFGEPIIVFLPDEKILGTYWLRDRIWVVTANQNFVVLHTKVPEVREGTDSRMSSPWTSRNEPLFLAQDQQALYWWEDLGDQGYALMRRSGLEADVDTLRIQRGAPVDAFEVSEGFMAWQQGNQLYLVETARCQALGCAGEEHMWSLPEGASLVELDDRGEALVEGVQGLARVTPDTDMLAWHERPSPHDVTIWDGHIYWVSDSLQILRIPWSTFSGR